MRGGGANLHANEGKRSRCRENLKALIRSSASNPWTDLHLVILSFEPNPDEDVSCRHPSISTISLICSFSVKWTISCDGGGNHSTPRSLGFRLMADTGVARVQEERGTKVSTEWLFRLQLGRPRDRREPPPSPSPASRRSFE